MAVSAGVVIREAGELSVDNAGRVVVSVGIWAVVIVLSPIVNTETMIIDVMILFMMVSF